MAYLPTRFTREDMTVYVISTIVQGSNAITGFTLDWNDFNIRPVVDPLNQDVGFVSAERRCVYDVYTEVEGINKMFRCYLKPDRLTLVSTFKEDIVRHNNPDPATKIYHLDVRLDERIFPNTVGPKPFVCPVFESLEDRNTTEALLQENGAAILQENGAVLLP